MEGEKEKKQKDDQNNDEQEEIHVVKEPIAKAVIGDIFKKIGDWSKFHPFFKEGIQIGYKDPTKCFRDTGDNKYEKMVDDIKTQIKGIAGSEWGPKYHTKRRAASSQEIEEFKKLYIQKFGSLGLESILFGIYDHPDDGIECGEGTGEGAAEGTGEGAEGTGEGAEGPGEGAEGTGEGTGEGAAEKVKMRGGTHKKQKSRRRRRDTDHRRRSRNRRC